MYKIYAQIGTSTNGQTFNKRFATTEKSPIFQSHKSYTNTFIGDRWPQAEKNEHNNEIRQKKTLGNSL